MAKILFLDETGDHSLTKIDAQYPVFGLCGIIAEETYHDTVLTDKLNAFKVAFFGNREIILHTADFTRNQRGFEDMSNHDFRVRFFAELEKLIAELDFKIVACVVRKEDHLRKYRLRALDPYLFSLSLLVERFIFECGSQGGAIIAESRDPTLNNSLELAFLDLKIRGTDYISATKIQKRIRSFTIREKQENIAGLQLADVVATPIGRHAIGKRTYPAYCGQGDFFSILRGKFRQDAAGKIDGMGLIVLPK
jgi:hypothetical protein